MQSTARLLSVAGVSLGLVAAVVSGCGSSSNSSATSASSTTKSSASGAVNPNAKEKSPPGDIPDSTAYVRYSPAGGGFSVKVPEGWARTGSASKATFTSNLNSMTIESRSSGAPLSVASVKSGDAAAMAKSLKNFKLVSVAPVHRSGATAIRIRYQALGPANSVTGKAPADAGERYIFSHNGKLAVLTLEGPKGADNVDPWKTVSDSVRWTG
jgi:hypothetical protein